MTHSLIVEYFATPRYLFQAVNIMQTAEVDPTIGRH